MEKTQAPKLAPKTANLLKRLTAPDMLVKLEGWARDGLTIEQISKNAGIAPTTLYKYREMSPEIKRALEKGKEVVDYEVENALYKSAMGYEVTEQQIDNKGNKRMVKRYIAPNVTAQIFLA